MINRLLLCVAASCVVILPTIGRSQTLDASWGVFRKLIGREYLVLESQSSGSLLHVRFILRGTGIVRQFAVDKNGRPDEWLTDPVSRTSYSNEPIALYQNGFVLRSGVNSGVVRVSYLDQAKSLVTVECTGSRQYTRNIHVIVGTGAIARARSGLFTGAKAQREFERIARDPSLVLGPLVGTVNDRAIECPKLYNTAT